MEKITHQNLHPLLSKSLTDTDFVLILNALIKFLRRGGKKQAAERFDQIGRASCRERGMIGGGAGVL